MIYTVSFLCFLYYSIICRNYAFILKNSAVVLLPFLLKENKLNISYHKELSGSNEKDWFWVEYHVNTAALITKD